MIVWPGGVASAGAGAGSGGRASADGVGVTDTIVSGGNAGASVGDAVGGTVAMTVRGVVAVMASWSGAPVGVVALVDVSPPRVATAIATRATRSTIAARPATQRQRVSDG